MKIGSCNEFPSDWKELSGLNTKLSNLKTQPSLTSNVQQQGSWKTGIRNVESASSITGKTAKPVRITKESLTSQAMEMLQSLQSIRQVRLQSSTKKLKAELLSEEGEKTHRTPVLRVSCVVLSIKLKLAPGKVGYLLELGTI